MNPAAPLNLPEDDLGFLRDLVKGSRQRTHQVSWVDRDGTKRLTVLNQTEVVRLNEIAETLKTSKSEVLRRAAHIPVAAAKRPPAEPKPEV